MIKKLDAYSAEPIPQTAKNKIDQYLNSGDLFRYTSKTSPVTDLERDFAKLLGVKYALSVSSCSAALFLSLESLGLPINSRIIIPAFTFAAVPSSIVNAKMQPVLVEVNDDFRIDIKDFSKKIDQNIDAVMISHMRGHTSDMDKIIDICKEKNIPIIEDAAHSLGTLWNGLNIGTLGDIGCFSFQSYKMINAGEGGMFVTNNPEIYAKAVIMSGAYEHNWIKQIDINDKKLIESFEKWQNNLPLYNLRMQNLSAIVAHSQLPELKSRISKGLKNHDYVANKLNSSQYINVPQALNHETRAPDSIQFNLIDLSTEEILNFQEVVNNLGIKVQVFGLSKDNARAYWNWNFIPGPKQELPKTKNMLEKSCDVRLPVWLEKDDLDFIAEKIIEAVNKIKNDNK